MAPVAVADCHAAWTRTDRSARRYARDCAVQKFGQVQSLWRIKIDITVGIGRSRFGSVVAHRLLANVWGLAGKTTHAARVGCATIPAYPNVGDREGAVVQCQPELVGELLRSNIFGKGEP